MIYLWWIFTWALFLKPLLSFCFIFHFCSNNLFERETNPKELQQLFMETYSSFVSLFSHVLVQQKSFNWGGIMHFKSLCKYFCPLLLLKCHLLVLDWQLGSVTMKKHNNQYNLTVLHSCSRQVSKPALNDTRSTMEWYATRANSVYSDTDGMQCQKGYAALLFKLLSISLSLCY